MFLTALEQGNLDRVEEMVRQGFEPSLADAAQILKLISLQRPERFERAAVRWVERYAAERAGTIDDLGRAVDVLELMREDAGAAATLAHLATSTPIRRR
jgi:hypothetical protein